MKKQILARVAEELIVAQTLAIWSVAVFFVCSTPRLLLAPPQQVALTLSALLKLQDTASSSLHS